MIPLIVLYAEPEVSPVTNARAWVVAISVLAAVGAGTGWLLSGGANGVAVATVLALTVAVLALLVQLFSVPWRASSPGDQSLAKTAGKLLNEIRQREFIARNRFLADSGDAKAADVRFTAAGYAPADLVTWRSDGGGACGSLGDIADYYAGGSGYPGLAHGRLVVRGAAGAGKTVLASQLVLDLIGPSGSEPEDRPRVPLRVSLSTFRPDTSEDADAITLASELDAWLADALVEAFQVPKATATALVEQNWILPVLDGLDEMDADLDDARSAAAVVRALNCPVNGRMRPVVLTCRTDRYGQLAATATAPGREIVLQDATVVTLEPLEPEQIKAFLARRFPEHGRAGDPPQERWQPVIEHIKQHPGGPLAAALGSPLRLFLAVTLYHQHGTRPEELIGLRGDELDEDYAKLGIVAAL